MALFLTAAGTLGLCLYQSDPNAAARARRFERCSASLAVGGLIGLVAAARFSSLMAAAAEDLDATDNEHTNTCAAGCGLSLFAGVVSMVAGMAAVVLQRRIAGAGINLRIQQITLRERFYGMATVGCLCVVFQLIAVCAPYALGHWSMVEADVRKPEWAYWRGDDWWGGDYKVYFSYDLWYLYTRDDPHDKNADKIKFLSGPKCKSQIVDVEEGNVDISRTKYCNLLLAATNTARVLTLLALLLTVVGARGLCRYRRSPNEATRVKSFERCCRLLAVGGLIGLISAVNYTSMMEKAAKELDAEKNFFTDTRAAGCALSLAASIISMVAGAAAVVLQRKWPGASAPGMQASKPTTGKKSGGCCAGDPKNHGCWAVPDGSNEGRAAQCTSSLGLILAVICLIVNFVFWTWAWASVIINFLKVPGAGIGIYIQLLCLLLSIIAYSLGLCCRTGERGWNCTAGFLRVLSVLYVVAFVCIATSHDRLAKAINKECEEDDDPWSDGDDCDSWLWAASRVFRFLYACVVLNLVFSLISAYSLKRAAPDWVDWDPGEASSGETHGPIAAGKYWISTAGHGSSIGNRGPDGKQPAGWYLSAWNAHGAKRNHCSSWVTVHSEKQWRCMWEVLPGKKRGTIRITTLGHKDQPAGWGLSAWHAHGAARDGVSSWVAVHSGTHWPCDWKVKPGTQPGTFRLNTCAHGPGKQQAGWGLSAWQSCGGKRDDQSSWVAVHGHKWWPCDWIFERADAEGPGPTAEEAPSAPLAEEEA